MHNLISCNQKLHIALHLHSSSLYNILILYIDYNLHIILKSRHLSKACIILSDGGVLPFKRSCMSRYASLSLLQYTRTQKEDSEQPRVIYHFPQLLPSNLSFDQPLNEKRVRYFSKKTAPSSWVSITTAFRHHNTFPPCGRMLPHTNLTNESKSWS